MSSSLLTPRERWTWCGCFVVVAVMLLASGFASADPDSALYASLSARLAEGPVSHWIAPQWWGHWDSEGWFREHPAGVFLLPTLLASLGLPAVPSSYVVGIGAGLAALVLIGHLVGRLTSRADGRAALVLLQLMPVAFLFRIRANHEYPMLVCLAAAIVAIDGVRRSWWWLPVFAIACTAALLVKGVFVVLVFAGAGLWVLINPTEERRSLGRPLVAGLATVVVMALVAIVYDAAYLRVTGETFWWPYWQRQMAPLSVASPIDDAGSLIGRLVFYVSRLLWHPAPWSVALVVALWKWRGRLVRTWRDLPGPARRGLLFALGFAAASVLVLSPVSRFAERYAFSASYAIAAAGAVVARAIWPRLRTRLDAADRAIPALPAAVWLLLMLARLVAGPLLPRIS